jgi:hypothetical protein
MGMTKSEKKKLGEGVLKKVNGYELDHRHTKGDDPMKGARGAINPGSVANAYLSCARILQTLMQAGVEYATVTLMHDGSGYFSIPLTQKNAELSWKDFITISSTIGCYVLFNQDTGVSVKTDVRVPVVEGQKNEDGDLQQQGFIARSICFEFTYEMRNFMGFDGLKGMKLGFDRTKLMEERRREKERKAEEEEEVKSKDEGEIPTTKNKKEGD